MKKVLLSAMLAVGCSFSALAATPAMTNYQGILMDSEGNAINGSETVTFSLYTASTGGTAVWTETKSVSINNGLCATELGSVTPLTDGVWSNPSLWLGVKVDNDEEMSPRTKILAVPYALRAKVAESVIGGGSGSGLGAFPVGTVLESTNPDDSILKSAGFKKVGDTQITPTIEDLSNAYPDLPSDNMAPPYVIAATPDLNKVLAFVYGREGADLGRVFDEASQAWSDINMSGLPKLSQGTRFFGVDGDKILCKTSDTYFIYSCSADSWVQAPNENAPQGDTLICKVQKVKSTLLVIGDDQQLYLYDIQNNRWETPISGAPTLNSSDLKRNFSLTLSDKVLFYDRTSITYGIYMVSLYDSITKSWSAINIPTELFQNQSVSNMLIAIESGKFVFAFYSDAFFTTYRYDLGANEWTQKSRLKVPSVYEGYRLITANYLIASGAVTMPMTILVNWKSGSIYEVNTYNIIDPDGLSLSIFSDYGLITINKYGDVTRWRESNTCELNKYVKQP